MAIVRQTPKCRYCSEDIAKPIFKDESHLPPLIQTIGDTFLRWEYWECPCDENQKIVKGIKQNINELNK